MKRTESDSTPPISASTYGFIVYPNARTGVQWQAFAAILLLTCLSCLAQPVPPLPVPTKLARPTNAPFIAPRTNQVLHIIHITDLVPRGTNFVFIIECSTNLISWQDAAILPANYNWNTWTNVNPPSNAFYRIVAVSLKK